MHTWGAAPYRPPSRRAQKLKPTFPFYDTPATPCRKCPPPPCPRAEELGKGAFSVVRSATRKADGQKSAVKVVERRKLGKGDLEALRSEAKLLGELDHPNIVKLHGWYEEDKTLYMALELCEGEESQARLGFASVYL